MKDALRTLLKQRNLLVDNGASQAKIQQVQDKINKVLDSKMKPKPKVSHLKLVEPTKEE